LQERNRRSPLPAENAQEGKHVWQRYLGREDVSFEPSYHDNPRSDVVDRLGMVLKCVLEIGCGSGSTGKLIKERFPVATVIGGESNLQAADLARKRMDRVYGTTFEELNADAPDFPKGSIDVALLLDVLELTATQFILLCEPAGVASMPSKAVYWRSQAMARFLLPARWNNSAHAPVCCSGRLSQNAGRGFVPQRVRDGKFNQELEIVQ